ncbi:MAG: amidinotransferase, partial [Actinobacteria bacterium]|nr:amidinotransferase [Actinomycetota bacterium]
MPIQDQISPLRKVYVRPPETEALQSWREYGWRSAPDPARAAAEHEAFRALLTEAGAEVVIGTSAAPDDPDAIYTYDPALMTDAGAILLRPGKAGRRGEPAIAAVDLGAAGVPVIATLGEPALAEGGDMCWLD